MSASSTVPTVQSKSAPWWSFTYVWMVIAGPAAVVVASFITLYLVINSPNTILEAEPAPQAQQGTANMAPAMMARNHAATGVVQVKPAAPEAHTVKP